MPKLSNLTETEIADLVTATEDAIASMQDFVNRIEKGYVDRIGDPEQVAWHFSILSRSASDMAVRMLMQAKMQKKKDEIEALRTQQR